MKGKPRIETKSVAKSSGSSGTAKYPRPEKTLSTTNQIEMGSRSNGRTVSGSNSTLLLARNIAIAISPKIGRLVASTLTEEDIDWLEDSLNKLESQCVAPEVLKQTHIGDLVRMFENHPKLGPKATKLIEKWGLNTCLSNQTSSSEVSCLTKANMTT